IVEWCRQNNFPRYGIGRCMKMDRESLIGLDAAVSEVPHRAIEDQFQNWCDIVDLLFSKLAEFDQLKLRVGYSRAPSIQPVNIPRLFVEAAGFQAGVLQRRLAGRSPSI